MISLFYFRKNIIIFFLSFKEKKNRKFRIKKKNDDNLFDEKLKLITNLKIFTSLFNYFLITKKHDGKLIANNSAKKNFFFCTQLLNTCNLIKKNTRIIKEKNNKKSYDNNLIVS